MDCHREVCVAFLLLTCAAFCKGNVRLTASSEQVEEHDQVTLTCSNLPALTTGVTWKRGETEIVSADPRVKVGFLQDTKEGKLTITKVEHDDEGGYTCTANGGQASNVLSIHVVHIKHSVTTSRKTVSFRLGSHLKLTCQADIHTDLIWLKELTRLESGRDGVDISVVRDEPNHLLTSTLTISNGNNHSGMYTCQSDHLHDHDHDHHEDDHGHHDDHDHADHDHKEDHSHEEKATINVKIGDDDTTSMAAASGFNAVLLVAGLLLAAVAWN